MKKSDKSLWQGRFSHIYFEPDALAYKTATHVIGRFPSSRVVEVRDYKRFFNRSRQSFKEQKKSPKLILAVKRPPFVYGGSSLCQRFGNDEIHYVTPALGCLYDCAYCYLQGKYESANIVLFVNNDEIIQAVKEEMKQRQDPASRMYVSLSYDTDLMLFEPWTGFCRQWLDFAANEPDVTVELRTKSAAYSAIEGAVPSKNATLSWTISPEEIARRYDKGATSLGARLSAASRAAAPGRGFRPALRSSRRSPGSPRRWGRSWPPTWPGWRRSPRRAPSSAPWPRRSSWAGCRS